MSTTEATNEGVGSPPEVIEVLAIPFELLRVVEGAEMALKTTDGRDVVLRTPTPQEFFDMHVRACAEVGAEPSMDIEQARRLVSARQ